MLALHDKKRKEINDELAKMKMKKERLLIDYNDGTINSEEYKYIRQKYDDEEQKLRRFLFLQKKKRKKSGKAVTDNRGMGKADEAVYATEKY